MKKNIRSEINKMTLKSANTGIFFTKTSTEPMKNEVKAISFLSTYITPKLCDQICKNVASNCFLSVQGRVFTGPIMRSF